MTSKPKFDKLKCKQCIYHTTRSGGFKANGQAGDVGIICSYSTKNNNDETCLYRDRNGVHDRRGNDYSNCLLFVSGARMKDKGLPK